MYSKQGYIYVCYKILLPRQFMIVYIIIAQEIFFYSGQFICKNSMGLQLPNINKSTTT